MNRIESTDPKGLVDKLLTNVSKQKLYLSVRNLLFDKFKSYDNLNQTEKDKLWAQSILQMNEHSWLRIHAYAFYFDFLRNHDLSDSLMDDFVDFHSTLNGDYTVTNTVANTMYMRFEHEPMDPNKLKVYILSNEWMLSQYFTDGSER